MDSGFLVLDSGFCIPGQWNRFPNAEFWTPKPRIPDSQAKISRIPESGLPYKGQELQEYNRFV